MDWKTKLKLVGWNTLLFLVCQASALKISSLGRDFLETRGVDFPDMAWWHFLLFVFGAVIIFLILIRLKLEIIFKILFIVLIIWGGFILFSLLLPFYAAVLLTLVLVFLWLFYCKILIHDLIFINGIVIFGIVFGFCFSPLAVAIILIIMSAFDLYAVHKGKYMQKMVGGMMKYGAVFGCIVPIAKISDFFAPLKEAVEDLSNVLAGGERERFSMLGGGDIAYSILMVISVLCHYGLQASLLVVGCGLVGSWAMYAIFILRKGRPMAALPPIAFFLIIGFLIVRFVL